MADAFLPILSVSSSRHLFAAAGEDEKVRIYDMQQDFGGQTRVISGGLWPVDIHCIWTYLAHHFSGSNLPVSMNSYELSTLIWTLNTHMNSQHLGKVEMDTFNRGKRMNTNSFFVTLLYMVYRYRLGLHTLRVFSWSVFGVVLGVATLLSRLHMRGTAQSLQEFTAVRVLEEASDYVRAAAWSQNLLATAGDDKTVRIYDFDQDREREARLWVRWPCGIPK